MVRRTIITKTPNNPLVKTTIHQNLQQEIQRFRKEYMQKTGRYINNSLATRMIANKIKKIRPSKKDILGRTSL